MKDCLGREIDYLRLSITERCNLRCIYCRDGSECSERHVEMTIEEIEKVTNCMAALGIHKVRVTGGEPLMRKDLEDIVSVIAQKQIINDLSITTNGQALAPRVKKLKAAGLKRFNISMDSLKPERYSEITRGGRLSEVLLALDEIIDCGFSQTKINVVLVRGENDNEIDDFIELAKYRPIDVRFIELMPIGEFGQKQNRRLLTQEILSERPYLEKLSPRYSGQPSEDYVIQGYAGRIGFISAVSHKFCSKCNRIRLTSDAKLKPCLGDNGEVSLRPLLHMSEEVLTEVIRDIIFNKPKGHNFDTEFDSLRGMSRIGG